MAPCFCSLGLCRRRYRRRLGNGKLPEKGVCFVNSPRGNDEDAAADDDDDDSAPLELLA